MVKVKLNIYKPVSSDSAHCKIYWKKGEGIHHIAFEVHDILTEMERLRTGFQVGNEQPKRVTTNHLLCSSERYARRLDWIVSSIQGRHDTSQFILAIVLAFAAGCINTLSGNGRFYPRVLWQVHMPAQLANGTNRLGLLHKVSQALKPSGRKWLTWSIRILKVIFLVVLLAPWPVRWPLFFWMPILRQVYKMLMLGMLVLALLRPGTLDPG